MRKEKGYCCVQYTVCDSDDAFSFYAITATMDAKDQLSQDTATECTADYISIEGGHGVCSTSPSLGGKTNTKFCGFHFNVLSAVKVNSPVCDCTFPFIVDVKSDATTDPGSATSGNTLPNRGVCLDFQ